MTNKTSDDETTKHTVFNVPPMGGAPLEATLIESRLIYYFATLRDIVNRHEITFNETKLTENDAKNEEFVSFYMPELIITQKSVDKPYPSTYLHNPVTFDAIKLFLRKNTKYIKQDDFTDYPIFVPDGSNTTTPAMTEMINYADGNLEFIDFDDRLANDGLETQLVFAILVNQTYKKISLVFRGTVNFKDILVDGNFWRSSTPLIQAIAKDDGKAKVHKGFEDYLLDKTKIDGNQSQYENIVAILKELYANPDYKNYNLVISGHSLGGALAQLSSFLLAGSEDLAFIPSPVEAITYASPVIGNHHFFNAYRKLEAQGKLRHIRVSNNRDIITGDPTFSRRYKQTGVNLHLNHYGKPAEIGYFNTTSSCVWLMSLDPLGHHSIYSETGYFERLYQKDEKGNFVNQSLLKMSTEELYAKHAELNHFDKGTEVWNWIGWLLVIIVLGLIVGLLFYYE